MVGFVRMFFRLILISVVVLSSCGSAMANNSDRDWLQLSGFGTLGITETDSETIGFRNDFSQNQIAYEGDYSTAPLSNLGVQMDALINSEWDAVAQWVYREQDKHDLDALTTMAFIRYSPSANWQFRAGRTAIDLFHLSEYRDVGIAYTWAKVPTEVYGFVPSRHIDGVDAQLFKDYSGVNFTLKGYYGEFESDFSSSGHDPIAFKDITGVRLTAETFDWSISLRHTQARVESNNQTIQFVVDEIINAEPLWPNSPEFADKLSMDDKEVTYSSLSGQYNLSPFLIMGEFAYISSQSSVLESVRNGYLSVIYQSDAHSFHLTQSFTDSTAYYFDEFVLSPQLLAPLIDAVERQLNAFATDQITRSIGWRFDVTPSVAVKVQWDNTEYKGRGSALLGSELILTERANGSLNSVHATVSFSF